jgi:hypothetical protein
MSRVLMSGLAVALLASVAVAGDGRTLRSAIAPTLLAQNGIPMPSPLSPVPDPVYSQHPGYSTPAFGGSTLGYPVDGQSAELFSDVRYHGTRNIAPCAVPTIIQVPDPCNRDKCCKSCVNVQVCVPPCEPQRVKVTRDGNRVRYDYGQYSVVVKSVGNHVTVHYGD